MLHDLRHARTAQSELEQSWKGILRLLEKCDSALITVTKIRESSQKTNISFTWFACVICLQRYVIMIVQPYYVPHFQSTHLKLHMFRLGGRSYRTDLWSQGKADLAFPFSPELLKSCQRARMSKTHCFYIKVAAALPNRASSKVQHVGRRRMKNPKKYNEKKRNRRARTSDSNKCPRSDWLRKSSSSTQLLNGCTMIWRGRSSSMHWTIGITNTRIIKHLRNFREPWKIKLGFISLTFWKRKWLLGRPHRCAIIDNSACQKSWMHFVACLAGFRLPYACASQHCKMFSHNRFAASNPCGRRREKKNKKIKKDNCSQ